MAFIRKKAQQYINSYNKNTIQEIYEDAEELGVSTKPFHIFDYIKHIKEIIYWEDYFEDDISGTIEYNSTNARYKIVINKYHSLVRRRFTLAHEFGHFLYHKDFLKKEKIEDRVLFRGGNINKMETQANEFAAELLMPKQIFEEKLKSGCTKIEELAKYFQVSHSAIKYRAFKLGFLEGY